MARKRRKSREDRIVSNIVKYTIGIFALAVLVLLWGIFTRNAMTILLVAGSLLFLFLLFRFTTTKRILKKVLNKIFGRL